MKWPRNADTGEPLDQAAARAFSRQNGTNLRPSPPRNLRAQSGSRKVLVTWDAPLITDGIVGYRIYTDTELSLLDSIYDPNVRQYSIPASSGATPPTKNIFVSTLTKNGESSPVQVQGAATAEAGAPTDPSVPPGSAASGTTGKDIGFDAGATKGGVGRL